MKQRIVHGAVVDALTPDELLQIIPRPSQVTRIRVAGTVVISATGVGDAEVYKVPMGYEFAARRIAFSLTGAVPSDPNTGNVLLNAAGKFVAYMRSGQVIEYGQPQYGSAIQIPGVQTWGDQQGPYLRNAEVFGVFASGLTANLSLGVYLEGLLHRPAEGDGHA